MKLVFVLDPDEYIAHFGQLEEQFGNSLKIIVQWLRKRSLLSFLFLLSWWKHQVKVVAHVLIEVGLRVLVAPIVQVDPVQVVVVGVDVVVNVQDEGDHGCDEAHVAQGVGSARHPDALGLIALLRSGRILDEKKYF